MEPYPRRRRTVSDGTAKSVKCFPFHCDHCVCGDCENKLSRRGMGTCPICRAERKKLLDNDARNYENAGSVLVSGALMMQSGRVFFPTIVPRSEPVRHITSHRSRSRSREVSASEDSPVELTNEGQQLVDALVNAVAVDATSFRSLVSSFVQRASRQTTSPEFLHPSPVPSPGVQSDGNFLRVTRSALLPTRPTLLSRVVRVVPHNP